MAIDRIDKPDGSAAAGLTGRRTTTGSGVDRTKNDVNRDVVDLSPEARRTGLLARAASGLSDVRTERVESLRDAVNNGTYEVEPRLVARAILEFEDGFSA